MLRQKFSKVVTSPKFYKKALVLSYLAGLAIFFIIPFLPTMGERGFISENAVSAFNPLPSFDVDRVYTIQQSIEKATQTSLSNSLSFIETFFMKNNVQPRKQEFVVSGDLEGTNLYGIYRTKRGDPGECNLISFSHDLTTRNGEGKFEIAMALSFLEMFAASNQINYNSRDIIFLAYDGRFKAYGKAVGAFLDSYFSDENIGMERCGTIRQAINIEIEKDDFNKLAVLYQGINGRVPDHDYYVMITKILDKNVNFWEFQKDYSFEKKLSDLLREGYYSKVAQIYQDLSGNRLPYFEATETLVNLKGLLIGNSHDAHTYMLEKGIQAVTLKGYECKNNCRGVKPLREALTALGETIEGINRGSQAIQEQLHAGSTYYLATAKRNMYFLLGSIAFVGLLILPVIVKAVITYYDQSSERNLLRASWEHAGILSTMWVVNKLPQIMEYVLGEVRGNEISLCPSVPYEGLVYDNSFILTFLFVVLGLILVGTGLFPLFSAKLFGDTKVKNYQPGHWKTVSALYCGYAAISLVGWSLSNMAIGLLGAAFVLPTFSFVSPIRGSSPKRMIGNLLAVLWIAGLWFGISYILQNNGLEWTDLAREMIIKQACHGFDLYRFTTFIVLPALIYIVKILFFISKE